MNRGLTRTETRQARDLADEIAALEQAHKRIAHDLILARLRLGRLQVIQRGKVEFTLPGVEL